jgi:hypothetical protein
MYLREIGCENVNWMEVYHDHVGEYQTDILLTVVNLNQQFSSRSVP